MTRHVRFSLSQEALPTWPDGHPSVQYGLTDGRTVFETRGPFSEDHTGASFPLRKVRLLPPCWPTKILCVGRNYPDHAKELGNEPPKQPIVFLKPHSSLIAHGDAIVYPPQTQLLNYEGELAVVIGARARDVPAPEAGPVIFGYTCLNDITARDLQRADNQWTRAKGFDTFCPVGPWIVPKEEVHLGALRVVTIVDGERKQDAPAADMLFGVNDIIAYVSSFLTLEPGDLIATGTPPGVGPLQVGSEVEVVIEGVGTLANRVIGP